MLLLGLWSRTLKRKNNVTINGMNNRNNGNINNDTRFTNRSPHYNMITLQDEDVHILIALLVQYDRSHFGAVPLLWDFVSSVLVQGVCTINHCLVRCSQLLQQIGVGQSFLGEAEVLCSHLAEHLPIRSRNNPGKNREFWRCSR